MTDQTKADHELEMAVGGNAGAAIAGIVDQLLEHDENIVRAQDQKKLIMATAKAEGFDVAGIRAVLAAKKKDEQERIDRERLNRLYIVAAGMQVAD